MASTREQAEAALDGDITCDLAELVDWDVD